tara:strand:- start:17738 stop:18220 length:483 start_codon:yes stop_codon:yes gene_type:complete
MPSKKKYRANVGAVILNKKGFIWIGKRSDIKNSSEWQMPQGGIDKNENPEKAVFREVYEETGIKSIKIIDKINTWIKYEIPKHIAKNKWNGEYIGQKQKWFLLYFYGNEKEININLSNKKEFKSWKWDKDTNIANNVPKFRKNVYKKVFNYFSTKIDEFT